MAKELQNKTSENKESEMKELIESLSPIERKIIPFIKSENFEEVIASSGMERVSVLRALEFLQNKKIVNLDIGRKKIVELGKNGEDYLNNGLPERRLLNILLLKSISLNDASKITSLNDQEFKAALGALKKKAIIEIKEGKIVLNATKSEIEKKNLEEQLLESLPREYESLKAEELYALKILSERKDIIQINDKQIVNFNVSGIGKKLLENNIKEHSDMIELLDSELIRSGKWEGKKFRRYNVEAQVPKIYGGKKHFVNQAINYGRKVWSEMGFVEMKGNLLQESFWNFDALYTAQDHPVRDLQDTFFLEKSKEIKDKKVVLNVKNAHEKGIGGNKGWGGKWDEKEAQKLVLRTHTTCLSAQTLYELSKLPKEQRKGKYFAIGKCFRNETVDWKHAFEFNQTEGIVIDKDANFVNLLGYLKEFFAKMGFEKVRFRPHYFPYTEPSVEIDAWHEGRKEWIELGGAGIFRPEVTIPLLGEWIPVLAWGPGFDRILMDYYEIKDLRELYKNDIKLLRGMKLWSK